MESYFANEFQDEAKDQTVLSLSDLHDELPSDAATSSHGFHREIHNWSSSSSSSTSSLDHQDLFEFFSGDHHWSSTSKTSTYSNNLSSHDVAPDNILFCGKLFPSKQPIISIINDHKFSHSRTIGPTTSNVGLFRRNYSDPSYYLQRSKSSAASTSNDSRIPRSKSVPVPRNGSLARKSGGRNKDNNMIIPKSKDDHDSILKWTTKSRWFVFMFGMSSPSGSATKKMELSDLRSRMINHRSPSSMLFRTSWSTEGDHQLVGGNIGNSCFSFRCFGGL